MTVQKARGAAMGATSKTIRVMASVLLAASACLLVGCNAQQEDKNEFSNVRYVANLTTMECYYHNVAKHEEDASGYIFGIGNIGEKRFWFEYDAKVNMGIDADKVKVSKPDENGIVTITMPPVEVQGKPDIIEGSMTNPLTETGWFTSITQEDRTKALAEAQDDVLEKADGDKELKQLAKERAKQILKKYVTGIGKKTGKTYQVEFKETD